MIRLILAAGAGAVLMLIIIGLLVIRWASKIRL